MSDKELYKANITIIGAGVVGLAIAARLARKDREVYIIEKNERFGQETSSRNSQVIHAGIYYPEGSLKARLCVEGNAMMYQACKKYEIEHRNTGKLIVATSEEETAELELLLERGKGNGVQGLRMLSKGEIKDLEPNVEAIAAVFSPATGIMDAHALMRSLFHHAKEEGTKVAFKVALIGIEKLSDGYEVVVEDISGIFSFRTEVIINCAGLYSDRIAQLAGIDIDEAEYNLSFCKGEYFSVGNNKNRLINRLVYPMPEHNITGAGIHASVDVEGRMRLGPSARYVDEIDYRVDESNKDFFYQSVKSYLPFIEYDDLEPEMAGIRPKLQGPGEAFRDFIITHESDKGLPGLINLIGIESPGLTSALAIAKYVENIVNDVL